MLLLGTLATESTLVRGLTAGWFIRTPNVMIRMSLLGDGCRLVRDQSKPVWRGAVRSEENGDWASPDYCVRGDGSAVSAASCPSTVFAFSAWEPILHRRDYGASMRPSSRGRAVIRTVPGVGRWASGLVPGFSPHQTTRRPEDRCWRSAAVPMQPRMSDADQVQK